MSVAILDIDGTLVDTNYHHTISWARAFARHEVVVPLWRLHRHIGMGGDQLVVALCGQALEDRLGDPIRDAEHEEYMRLIDEVAPMEGSREFILALKNRRHSVVLASSAKQDELDHYLHLLDARELADRGRHRPTWRARSRRPISYKGHCSGRARMPRPP